MKIEQWFPMFFRLTYPNPDISNGITSEDILSLGVDFEEYLFNKVGEEKARTWYPESIIQLSLQSDHPLKHHGFELPLAMHFFMYIEEMAKQHNESDATENQ